MGARSSSCSTTSPYCWLSPESCLSATPTKLCPSKQSLPHPFFTRSEGTSMLRQKTCMPSLPMTIIFFYAVGKVNLLLNPAIVSFTLSRNIWLPFWIGIGSIACVFVATAALPSTRSNTNKQDRSPTGVTNGHPHGLGEQQPLLQDGLRSGEEESEAASQPIKQQVSPCEHIQRNATRIRTEWRDFTPLFNTSRNSSLIFSIFFVLAVSASVANILLQYISIRYHWTLAQAGYLFTMKAGVGLFLYTVLVPCDLYILTQWRKQPKPKLMFKEPKFAPYSSALVR